MQLLESEALLFCSRTCNHFNFVVPLCSSLQPRTDPHSSASHIRKLNLPLLHPRRPRRLLSPCHFHIPLSDPSLPSTSIHFLHLPQPFFLHLKHSPLRIRYSTQHESHYGETIAYAVAEVRELALNVVRGNLQLRDKCESFLAPAPILYRELRRMEGLRIKLTENSQASKRFRFSYLDLYFLAGKPV